MQGKYQSYQESISNSGILVYLFYIYNYNYHDPLFFTRLLGGSKILPHLTFKL